MYLYMYTSISGWNVEIRTTPKCKLIYNFFKFKASKKFLTFTKN